MGYVRTSSIARWKARGRLPIRYNWTFFACSCGWDVISRLVEVGVFQRRWIILSANFRWKGTSPTNLFLYQNTRLNTFHVVSKFQLYVFHFVTKHACDGRTDRQTDGRTDGRTDRQNYDSQDTAYIAASGGKYSGSHVWNKTEIKHWRRRSRQITVILFKLFQFYYSNSTTLHSGIRYRNSVCLSVVWLFFVWNVRAPYSAS